MIDVLVWLVSERLARYPLANQQQIRVLRVRPLPTCGITCCPACHPKLVEA